MNHSFLLALAVVFLEHFCDSRRLRVEADTEHQVSNSTAQQVSNSTAQYPAVVNPLPGSAVDGRSPRVYFLFLAVDKVSNLEVWKTFFSQAAPEQYRAYVHCKLPSCLAQIAGSHLIPVPTVPSYYCTDLVSPMNQLLAYAINSDPGPSNVADKFTFVSDSSLPAKPFSLVFSAFTQRRGSDFCAFPSGEWADIPGAAGMEVAVKHFQWVTLEREHAVKANGLWASGHMHDLMSRFRMNQDAYTWSNNSFADNRNFGCLDEFWHMAAIYGTIPHGYGAQDISVQLPMFTGGPLYISSGAGWQGHCDTFVVWSKYMNAPGNNPFKAMHDQLDPVSIPHGGNTARPGWWDTISSHGITTIRYSGFLFVRKFIDNPTLTDGGLFSEAYSRLVLTQ